MNIKDLQEWAHSVSKEKGFYDPPPTVQDRLVLMHSEISEALEEWRNPEKSLDGIYFSDPSDLTSKPEGFGIELADAVIRIADCCEYLGIDLTKCLEMKMQYNQTRPYRHGNKRA